MKKIIFRHMNRTLFRCIEVAGVLALVAILAWLGLLWRLSQGPLDVDPWLTAKIEQALDRDINGFDFELGSAQLTWGGRFEPFEFEMRDVRISRNDGTPVLDVQKLRVQLSKRNLVFGRIVPRVIRVTGPALRVIRQENGQFSLNVSPGAQAVEDKPSPSQADEPLTEKNRRELVKEVLRLLQERTGLGMLDGLREVFIADAALLYEDKVMNVRWLSRNADINVARGEKGIFASSLISIDMDTAKKATVRAEVNYDWDTQRTETTVAFTGFIPAKAAQSSETLKQLSDIAMPFSGSLTFGLDPDFRPTGGRFAIGAEAGTFNALGLYAAPIPVTGLFVTGKLDANAGEVASADIKADLGGPLLSARAKLDNEGSIRIATFEGTLTDMPLDSLKVYWPDTLAPSPRDWVTRHLSKGIATKATISAVAAIDTAAEKKVTLRSLKGNIDYKGITVDYFPPLPTVTEATGTANYDPTNFNLDISSARLQDMKITGSKIFISDLDKVKDGGVSKIDISASLHGPLRTALKVLDSKPLGYPEQLGIKSAEVEGTAENVEVTFKFPLRKSITLNDIRFTATSTIKDGLLKDVVAGMDLTGGPMKVEADNAKLTVKGKGKLAGMPVDFDWVKNFPKDADVSAALTASLPLDVSALAKFGVPSSIGMTGSMPAKVEYTLKRDKTATLGIKGDLRPLGFTVPMVDFTKTEGVAGSIAMNLALNDNKLQRATGVEISGAGVSMKGDVDFGLDGMGATTVKKASIKEFSMGPTNVAVNVEPMGSGYSLKVTGKQIDASSLFKDSPAPNSDVEAAKQAPPIRLNLSVNRMLTGKDRAVERVKVAMMRNEWKRIDQLEVDALTAGKPLQLKYMPAKGGHTLKFEAHDAGAALAAFGFAKSIKGGVLRIDGRPRVNGGPRDMVGTATLNGFKIANAPVIAKILNALSLVGLFQMMGDNGLVFKKARVDFAWVDKGQPQQKENVRILKLNDGKTFGSSLGLTFEGTIDNWKYTYDINGTIVPVSDISKLLSIIPIVGTVLTAGGEGIFAATYKVTGPKEDPVVSVNPLSALAPGILRKMFFE